MVLLDVIEEIHELGQHEDGQERHEHQGEVSDVGTADVAVEQAGAGRLGRGTRRTTTARRRAPGP